MRELLAAITVNWPVFWAILAAGGVVVGIIAAAILLLNIVAACIPDRYS